MSTYRIPVTIITGFLGSGKTTLIRHIISNAGGKRLALIVNEFGDIGMDAAMLGDRAYNGGQIDNIIELANGCIFVTVADDFLPIPKDTPWCMNSFFLQFLHTHYH